MAVDSSSGKKTKKVKKSKKDEGFLASIELKRVLYFGCIPIVIIAISAYAYTLASDWDGHAPAAVDGAAAADPARDFALKAPIPLSSDFNIRRHSIEEVEWSDEAGFIEGVVQAAVPVRIRNSPVRKWPISSWDLGAMAGAEERLILNASRLQTASPVFVLGHERDRGGMLGAQADLPVQYVDVYLKDFLQSVFDKDTYLYWTGPCSVFEQFEGAMQSGKDASGPDAGSKLGAWEVLKVVDSGVNISRGDESLWTPMLWLSHPAVVAQTHYDTQHNFFAQILGKKKMLIFEQQSELYPYPNIHRSYRQSQLHLENATLAKLTAVRGQSMPERFPMGRRLDAVEVSVSPGDLLYIPPYYSHRVESETLSMSVSILSPSATEVRQTDRHACVIVLMIVLTDWLTD
jgi:hypothetical protein